MAKTILALISAAACICATSATASSLRLQQSFNLSFQYPVDIEAIAANDDGGVVLMGYQTSGYGEGGVHEQPFFAEVTRSGDVKWKYAYTGSNTKDAEGPLLRGSLFAALHAPDGRMILCGEKILESHNMIPFVLNVDSNHRVEETEVKGSRVGTHLVGCHRQSDGILLLGSVYGQPAGTGWAMKLAWDMHEQWERFGDDYGAGDAAETTDGVTTLSWTGDQYHITRINAAGDIVAKLTYDPGNPTHLVRYAGTGSPVTVVAFKSNTSTEISEFDAALTKQLHTRTLSNVGVNRALGCPDGSLFLFGSKNLGLLAPSPSAAITRVNKSLGSTTEVTQPQHESYWYADATFLPGNKEVASVRLTTNRKIVLDFYEVK